MKTRNIYTDLIMHSWKLVKKVSIAIVSAIPTGKVFRSNASKSRVPRRNEEIGKGTDKYYHRPISKPAVEKQTLLKETKKQKKYV